MEAKVTHSSELQFPIQASSLRKMQVWHLKPTAGKHVGTTRRIEWFQSATDAFAPIVLDAAGCSDDLACLRALPFDAVFSAANGTFNPAVIPDGDFIQAPTFKLIGEGKIAQVPLILGANLDEATSGIGAPVGIQNDTQFRGAVARKFQLCIPFYLPGVLKCIHPSGAYSTLYPSNATLDKFLSIFPDDPSRGSPFGTGAGVLPTGLQDKRINWVYTDGLHGGIRYLARKHSAQAPVYKYHFTQVPQNGTIDAGVAHFYEIPYVSQPKMNSVIVRGVWYSDLTALYHPALRCNGSDGQKPHVSTTWRPSDIANHARILDQLCPWLEPHCWQRTRMEEILRRTTSPRHTKLQQ